MRRHSIKGHPGELWVKHARSSLLVLVLVPRLCRRLDARLRRWMSTNRIVAWAP